MQFPWNTLLGPQTVRRVAQGDIGRTPSVNVPSGASMAHKPWGSALSQAVSGIPEALRQNAALAEEKRLNDARLDIQERTMKLAEAKQAYDLDPESPLNQKNLALAKEALADAAGKAQLYKAFGQSLGAGGGGGAAQDNALLAPGTAADGAGRFSPGGILSGETVPQRSGLAGGVPPGQPARGSAEEAALNAKRAALLGNKPLQQSFDKEADRRDVYRKKAAEARAKRDQEAEGKIEADYDAADRDLMRFNLIEKLNEQANTGGLAAEKDAIIAIAKEFGYGEMAASLFDGSMDATTARAAMESITNELVVGMIGQGKFPANNFSDQDRKFIMAMFPQLKTLPGGNRLILKILIQDRKFAKLKGDKFMEWREKNPNKGMREWRREWNSYKNKNNTMGKLREEANALLRKGKKGGGVIKPEGTPSKDSGQSTYQRLMAQ